MKNNRSLEAPLVRELEAVESRYWQAYYQPVPHLKTFVTPVSGALACAIPSLDVLAFNRVIGLGQQSVLSTADLEAVIHFYKKAGSTRFFVQLPPQLVDELTACTLDQAGFVHHNHWSKLQRDTSPYRVVTNPALTIERISQDNASLFGEIIGQCFDWENPQLSELLSLAVGQRGYRHYVVRLEGEPIAAGALYVEGRMAAMAFAGTLAPFRGLGAQTLLLKTRIEEARSLGAEWICAETAQHSLEKPVKSYQNMCNAGFELAYQRQNWLYRF